MKSFKVTSSVERTFFLRGTRRIGVMCVLVLLPVLRILPVTTGPELALGAIIVLIGRFAVFVIRVTWVGKLELVRRVLPSEE